MNFSVILLVAVVAMATFTSVEGWRRRRFRIRIRGRRILKALCSPVCSTTCRAYCTGCAPVCAYGCSRICRGKREANNVNTDGSYVKPMPCDFEVYDVNGDKIIDHEELGRQNDESADAEDVKQLFTFMDLDGDGRVSPDEFEVAPLIKDCVQDNYNFDPVDPDEDESNDQHSDSEENLTDTDEK